MLRENVLASKTVTIKTLHHFARKAVSFSLAIAGRKLCLREIFKAVSGLVRNSKPAVKATGLLQSELEYWQFLDDWLVRCRGGGRDISLPLCTVTLPRGRGEKF